MKEKNNFLLLILIIVVLVSILLCIFYIFKIQKPVINYLERNDIEVVKLLSENSDLIYDNEYSLPPHLFYEYVKGSDKYILYTTEGSGVKNIFDVKCFQLKNNRYVYVGSYTQNEENETVLTDINEFNLGKCK